jgi:hypothetical protein
VQSVKSKIVKLVFVASVLRIESKGWLAWNQDNVYERRHVYPRTVVSVSPRFLCRPTAFFRLAVAVGRQRALHTENSGFSLQLWVSTFPRFVAI